MAEKEKESYYKILGTTAKIGNARIKEKYIQALKKHPPETDPEGFEKVREAYETLKDPEKRKQYDFMRKYGANVEDLLEEAYHHSVYGDFKKAKKLLERANKISPDNPSILMGLMMLAIEKKDFVDMRSLFNEILKILSENETEERAGLYAVKASMLLNEGYQDEAMKTLEEAKKVLPEEYRVLAPLLARVYAETGKIEEAWDEMNIAIPTTKDEEFEDIHLFILWSNMMLQFGIWKDKSKVQSRFRKFLNNLTDEQEKDIVYDLLFEAYNEFYDEGRYREAEFFIDLLKPLDNSNSKVNETREITKKLARVQKDLERLQTDEDAFPLLPLHAFEWFYKDVIPAMQLEEMMNSIPSEIMQEMKEEKELYAAGILRLKKKYPNIYKHFQADWDQLFNELTIGFNREMKRELKRLS